MNLFHVILLSIIEGVTEFLPISSTGHLVLASDLLKIQQTEFVKSFEIFIQLGAILAAVWLYGKNLFTQKGLFVKVLVAFLPTGLIGLVSYRIIKGFLIGNSMITAFALLLGGVLFIILETFVFKDAGGSKTTLKSLSVRDALLLGLFQSISVIPGVSRAGATIIGGLLLNMNRKSAVEFSFLLAIPTMLAATVFDLSQAAKSFSGNDALYLLIGFIVSFFTALFAIRAFIKFVQTNTFIPFGIYRIVLAILFFLFVLR